MAVNIIYCEAEHVTRVLLRWQDPRYTDEAATGRRQVGHLSAKSSGGGGGGGENMVLCRTFGNNR
jgi:hypothetical protein